MKLFPVLFSALAVLVSASAARVGGRRRKLLWLDADIAGTVGEIADQLEDLDIDIAGQLGDIDIVGQLGNIDVAGIAGQVGDFLGGLLGGTADETEAPTAAPSTSPPTSSPTPALDDTTNSTNSTTGGDSRNLVSEVGLFTTGEIVDEAMVDEGSELEVELDEAETDIEGVEGSARKVRRGLR